MRGFITNIFQKLKKQNGEAFAQSVRNHHAGILENIPELDVILRHAGRDAELLLPYLMGLKDSLGDQPIAPRSKRRSPFMLLADAGYKAEYADTPEKLYKIEKFFEQGEELCSFADPDRCDEYYIITAVKKNVKDIRREDFRGKEERNDDYGTSVITIQILRTGGVIKITNRYNHTVLYPDNTYNSNPDNIILGLSGLLRKYFNVEFSANKEPLPEGFILIGNQIVQYHTELNNIYYGDQAYVQNGVIHKVDRRGGDALFDGFLFDGKTKTLRKIDNTTKDSFAEDFNRDYGGDRALTVDKNGNLTLDGEILIGTEQSRIKTINLSKLTTMSNKCLSNAPALTNFEAQNLTTMGSECIKYAPALTNFEAQNLTTMRCECFYQASTLTHFKAPNLTTMGSECFRNAPVITQFDTQNLTTMGNNCLYDASALTHFKAHNLTSMGKYCFWRTPVLTHFNTPILTTMGDQCFEKAPALTHFEAPNLTSMDSQCLSHVPAMTNFEAENLTKIGICCFFKASALTNFKALNLTTMGNGCFFEASILSHFEAPNLTTMGDQCFENAPALPHFEAHSLTKMGNKCFMYAFTLINFKAEKLSKIGNLCLVDTPVLTHFEVPNLTEMGDECLCAPAMTHFEAPNLTKMGSECFEKATVLKVLYTPMLVYTGDNPFIESLISKPASDLIHNPSLQPS